MQGCPGMHSCKGLMDWTIITGSYIRMYIAGDLLQCMRPMYVTRALVRDGSFKACSYLMIYKPTDGF